MGRIPLICLASFSFACAPFAARAANRSVAPPPKTAAVKKTANPLLPGKSIEPMEAPEKTPGTGWSGFYFGVNAGAARSETNR